MSTGLAGRVRWTALIAAALFLFGAVVHTMPVRAASPNDVARFLAGLPPSEGSPLADVSGTRVWQRHAAAMDAAWENIETRQLSRIRAWSTSELAAPSRTLYYFFSGPDFLYADAFFPAATTYVLAALEPSGPLPTVGRHRGESLSYGLTQLRSSLNSVLNFSFFRTREMRTTLSANAFSGTLPILYVFLARTGKTIDDVTFHDINEDGRLVAAGEGLPRGAANVTTILFKGRDGQQRTLHYVQTDLSNGGWRRSGFKAFTESMEPGDALVKSASYLLHMTAFTDVRAHLLERSKRLLQDDSGIPISSFKREEWQLRPYGRYLGPIAVFPDNYQKQLAELFRSARPPAIDFGVGYRFRLNESNILIADKLTVRAAER
jgi:hypothetical protein